MAEAAEGEFDLRSLDDAELVEQVHDDMYNGLKAEVEQATHIFLERGWGPDKVLNDALVEGMRIVGIDFRDGILFVPEVLLAANATNAPTNARRWLRDIRWTSRGGGHGRCARDRGGPCRRGHVLRLRYDGSPSATAKPEFRHIVTPDRQVSAGQGHLRGVLYFVG
jgi:hypothetical protein